VFLDITASSQRRKTLVDMVSRVAREVNIPFTVGGGIGSVADVEALLNAGADKISINSSALARPELIDEIAARFGSQVCVVAIDARCVDGDWQCFTHGGSRPAGRGLFEWAAEAEHRGAGELLFTSMDHDGVKQGFACDALARLSASAGIPVIASGGGGRMEHFAEVFELGNVDAALAASVFHYNEIGIGELKKYLQEQHITVRL